LLYKIEGLTFLVTCCMGSTLSNRNIEIKFAELFLDPKKGKEFRWVSNTLARGPRFGPDVLPIFLSHFPATVQVHRKKTSTASLISRLRHPKKFD
jgi:hypothetical protein